MPGDPDELRAQRLALASLLGARLVSLGMTKHAEHLRRYYAAGVPVAKLDPASGTTSM